MKFVSSGCCEALFSNQCSPRIRAFVTLGGEILFTGGGQFSLANTALGTQYSLVNSIWGDPYEGGQNSL